MSETTELTVIPAASLPQIIAADTGGLLAELARKVAEFRAGNPDVSRSKDREAMRKMGTLIRSTKAEMDRLGKSLGEDAKKTVDAINAERRILKEKLEQLEDDVRGPLTAYEEAEKQRIADNEAALAAITEGPAYGQTETAAEIANRLDNLRAYPHRDWREFTDRAQYVLATEIGRMEGLHAAAMKREADAAELARLKAEESERQRLAEIEAQREREKAIARRAEEDATRRAQEEADRKAKEAAAAAEAVLRAAREETARKDREAAEALEAERRRAERERIEAQAAAERAEAARLRDEAAVKMAEARAAQVERDRQAAIAQAKKDAAELAAKVDADRQEAERRAEQRRVEAIAAERRRAEAEKAEEERKAAARAANVEHKRKINLAAQVALAHVLVAEGVGHDLAATAAKAVVIAIAKSEIPSVKVEY